MQRILRPTLRKAHYQEVVKVDAYVYQAHARLLMELMTEEHQNIGSRIKADLTSLKMAKRSAILSIGGGTLLLNYLAISQA